MLILYIIPKLAIMTVLIIVQYVSITGVQMSFFFCSIIIYIILVMRNVTILSCASVLDQIKRVFNKKKLSI